MPTAAVDNTGVHGRDLIDVTTIPSRNAGTFESRRGYESIARCDADIRDPFRHLGSGDYLTMKNIEAVAAYLESIQR